MFEDTDRESGKTVFVGSKMETALLKFAQELGWGEYKKTRDMHEVVQMIPFSSEKSFLHFLRTTRLSFLLRQGNETESNRFRDLFLTLSVPPRNYISFQLLQYYPVR